MMVLMLLLGILLVILASLSLWRQMTGGEFSFGRIIFTVWLPGMAGGILIAVSTILLIASAIKGM
jgi:hypothetical protein